MNKNEFMHILQQELKVLGPETVTDILADFEEHFANGLARGKSEAEITAELGDPLEIAQQYMDSTEAAVASRPVLETARYRHPDTPQAPASAAVTPRAAAVQQPAPAAVVPSSVPQVSVAGVTGPATQPASRKINEAALVAVIVFNIFLGIPIWIALYSTLFGFWVAAGGIGVAACVLFATAIIKAGVTSLILMLFGLSLTALTILAVILMVYLTKWLCLGLAAYVRWNRHLVTGGTAA